MSMLVHHANPRDLIERFVFPPLFLTFPSNPNISDERDHGSRDLQQIKMHTASHSSLHAYNNDGFALM